MSHRVISLWLILPTILLACKDGEFGAIGIDQDLGPITVNGIFGSNPTILCDEFGLAGLEDAPFGIDLSANAEYEKQKGRGVKSMVVSSLSLNIIPPQSSDTDNFDFLDRLEIYADDNAGDATPGVLVASLDPVPTGVTTLNLNMTGADIKGIVTQDDFEITTSVSGRQPCDDVDIDGEIVITVDLF